MKKKYQIITLLLLAVLLLTSCNSENRISSQKKQEFLNYMETKYNQEFEITNIGYIRQSSGDPVIPKPDFMKSYSDDIKAEMTVKEHSSSEEIIEVNYDASTGEFTDNFRHKEIEENLFFYGYYSIISEIEEVTEREWDYRNMFIRYPQGIDGYYDLEAYQPDYAIQYLKEHEVSIGNGNVAASVVCDETRAEEVLKRLDYIFLELFRSDNNLVSIKFYSTEQNDTENQTDSSLTSLEPYMYVSYSGGQRHCS